MRWMAFWLRPPEANSTGAATSVTVFNLGWSRQDLGGSSGCSCLPAAPRCASLAVNGYWGKIQGNLVLSLEF